MGFKKGKIYKVVGGKKQKLYKRTVKRYVQRRYLFDLLIGDKVYKEGTDFTFNPNTGLIEFKGGQYPNISSLPEGTKVKLRASVPEREKPEEKPHGWYGEKYYSLPLLPGTQFRCGYSKGGKKNPGGMTIRVNGQPSGEMFVDAFGNLAGHWKDGFNWRAWAPPGPIGNQGPQGSSYNDKWTPGDTGYTVRVWSHYNGDAAAYPKYPAFTKEWSLDVVGVIIKQV